MMTRYLTKNDVAQMAGVCDRTVKFWHKTGRLETAATTPRGIRLFDPKTVKRFLARRAKQRRT